MHCLDKPLPHELALQRDGILPTAIRALPAHPAAPGRLHAEAVAAARAQRARAGVLPVAGSRYTLERRVAAGQGEQIAGLRAHGFGSAEVRYALLEDGDIWWWEHGSGRMSTAGFEVLGIRILRACGGRAVGVIIGLVAVARWLRPRQQAAAGKP